MKNFKTPTIFYVAILAIGICCAGAASSVTNFIYVLTLNRANIFYYICEWVFYIVALALTIWGVVGLALKAYKYVNDNLM